MGRDFKVLAPNDWQAFEQLQPEGSMLQCLDHYRLLQKRQRPAELVGLVDGTTILAGGLVEYQAVRGGQVLLVQHGPLLDYQDQALLTEFLAGLKAYAKQKNVLYIRFSPNTVYQQFNNQGTPITDAKDQLIRDIEAAGSTHRPFETGMTTTGALRWQYAKDLRGLTPETVRETYAKDVRYYLKKTEQFGVTTRRLTRDELPAFKHLTQDTADRIGFADKDLDFYETVFDIYGDQAHFMVAEVDFAGYVAKENDIIAALEAKLTVLGERLAQKETKKNRGQFNEFTDQKQQHEKRIEKIQAYIDPEAPNAKQIVAGALFLAQPQEFVYWYSGTYEKYKEFYGPYVIQDEMIREATRQGVPMYNFQGIAGDFSGQDGVFRFKTEFGGVAEKMIGEFDIVVQPTKYRLYKLMKRVLGRG